MTWDDNEKKKNTSVQMFRGNVTLPEAYNNEYSNSCELVRMYHEFGSCRYMDGGVPEPG
jgi:hypothetical protein